MELFNEDIIINEIRINLIDTFGVTRDRADELLEEYYDIITKDHHLKTSK